MIQAQKHQNSSHLKLQKEPIIYMMGRYPMKFFHNFEDTKNGCKTPNQIKTKFIRIQVVLLSLMNFNNLKIC
jgi:hypothetical protein